eukprot:1234543-Amphidinium_carterae.2
MPHARRSRTLSRVHDSHASLLGGGASIHTNTYLTQPSFNISRLLKFCVDEGPPQDMPQFPTVHSPTLSMAPLLPFSARRALSFSP